MRASDLIHFKAHRPFPIPMHDWKFYQEWNDVLFLHWPIAKAELQPFMPTGLELDDYKGQCWVSVVCFDMHNVRFRYAPAFPPVSNFHEVNVRTYVKYGDTAGVYFLSIEAGKRLANWVCKKISGMPYRYSTINRSADCYSCIHPPKNQLEIRYSTGGVVLQKGDLDLWLTERYCLIQENGNQLLRYHIHHLEWPIQQLTVESLTIDYQQFRGFFNSPPTLMHYSKGVQVVAWGKEVL